MARDTPPTLISYTEIAYNVVTYPRSSAVVSWNAGDLIVAIGGSEGSTSETVLLPTATGLTFTQRQSRAASSSPAAAAFTAVAASAGSSAITSGLSAGTITHWGLSIWVWRGSDGVGITWCPPGAAALTTTQTPTDTHSAFCWGTLDWNAVTPTGVGVPTPTDTDESALEAAGSYSVYMYDLVDLASSASQAFGISAYTGSGPLVHIGVEVLGTTTAPPYSEGPASPGLAGMFDPMLNPLGVF